MLQVSYLWIKAGFGKAVVTETGKAVIGNLQHNEMAITKEVRRDCASTKSQMENMTLYVTQPAWRDGMLIYGKQEIRDGWMGNHASLKQIAFLSAQLTIWWFCSPNVIIYLKNVQEKKNIKKLENEIININIIWIFSESNAFD